MTGESEHPARVLAILENGSTIDAIGSLLNQVTSPGMQWLGAIRVGKGAGQMVASQQANLVLVDVESSPLREQAIRDAVLARPQARVAVLGRGLSFTQIVQCLEAGAWGYIEKDDGEEAIVQAVTRIARGEIAISPGAENTLRERGWRVASQPDL